MIATCFHPFALCKQPPLPHRGGCDGLAWFWDWRDCAQKPEPTRPSGCAGGEVKGVSPAVYAPGGPVGDRARAV